MVYGGAVAAGAFAGQDVQLFGWTLEPGLRGVPRRSPSRARSATRSARSAAGGSGLHGGRPFLERHGRWLHLNEAKLDRAERWFERWEDWAVFLGRADAGRPLVRLDPGRRLRGAVPALHDPDAARLGDLVLRASPASAGRSAAAGRTSTTPSATSTTRSSRWSWQGPPGWPGSTCVGAASPQRSLARLFRP